MRLRTFRVPFIGPVAALGVVGLVGTTVAEWSAPAIAQDIALANEVQSGRFVPSGLPLEVAAWPHWPVAAAPCAEVGSWPTPRYCKEAFGQTLSKLLVEYPTDEIFERHPTSGRIQYFSRQFLEAAAAIKDLGTTAVKCVVQEFSAAPLTRFGYSPSEVQRVMQMIAALVELGDLALDFGGLLDEPSIDNVIEPSGTLSAGLGETLEAAIRARHSSHRGRINLIGVRLRRAERGLADCQATRVEASLPEVLQEAVGYLEETRGQVEHYELQVYCRALATPPRSSPSQRLAAVGPGFLESLSVAHTYQAEAAGIVVEVAERLRALGDELADVRDWRQRFVALAEAALGNVDTALFECQVEAEASEGDRGATLEKLEQEIRTLRTHACVLPTGMLPRLSLALDRILDAVAQHERVRERAEGAELTVDSALSRCAIVEADDVIGSLRRFESGELGESLLSLPACSSLSWPLSVELDERVRETRRELSDLRRGVSELIARGSSAAERCDLAEAEPLVEEAWMRYGSAKCEPSSDHCEGDQFNPDLCALSRMTGDLDTFEILVRDRRWEAEAVAEDAEELRRRGEALLDISAGETAERCSALDDLESVARELDSLGLGSPCGDRMRERLKSWAAELRDGAESARDSFQRSFDGWLEAGRRAADNCDPAALANAVDEVEALERVACQATPGVSNELRELMSSLEQALFDTDTVLLESRQRLSAWQENCDASQLGNLEAEIGNLPACAFDNLSSRERAELQTLYDWGERAPAMRQRMREIRAARDDLQKAEIQFGAARRRRSVVPLTAQDRAAERLELSRAEEALDRARITVLEVAEDRFVPRSCWQGSLERVELLDGELQAAARAADPDRPISTTRDDADWVVSEVVDTAVQTAKATTLIDEAVGAAASCDYRGATARIDQLASDEPRNPWLAASREWIDQLKKQAALDVAGAVRRATQALATRELDEWTQAMSVVLRSGCRNEKVDALIDAARKLERQAIREVDQRVADAVRAGRAGIGSFNSDAFAQGLVDFLTAWNEAQGAATTSPSTGGSRAGTGGAPSPITPGGQPSAGPTCQVLQQHASLCRNMESRDDAGVIFHWALEERSGGSTTWAFICQPRDAPPPSGAGLLGPYATFDQAFGRVPRSCR